MRCQRNEISALRTELATRQFEHQVQLENYRDAHNGIVNDLTAQLDWLIEKGGVIQVFRLGAVGHA